MLKRKLSEFSMTSGNFTYKEDKENLDVTGIPNYTKKKLQKDDAIRTYCRIRQIDNNPGIFKIAQDDEKTLKVNHDELPNNNNQTTLSSTRNFVIPNCNSFNFSKIFDTQATQIDIFTSTCLPLINDLVRNKKSGLIFSYGLTNAGKTHTIIGNPTNPGILPLSLKCIYEKFESEIDSGNLTITPDIFCNYIEIYNEEVFDLLANEGKSNKCKKKVNVKEKDKIFYVQNVTNKPVKSLDDFNDALNLGVMKKTHASTQLNNYSSRSHTIFKLIIRWPINNINDSQDNDEHDYNESSLSIVDLAGSERAYRAETSGKELQQACKINHSLYVLGKCMEIMKYNSLYTNKKIVPFRESKLTMLFQEYFQGEENIIMITNINPGRDDYEETLRVLSYACIAKEIRPIKSKIITNNFRKKEKNSVYDSCSSEDEEKKINNKLIQNSNKYDSTTSSNVTTNIFNGYHNSSLPLGESFRTLNISGFHHNSINSNHNSTYADDIDMLKYEFMNMSRRYEEHLEKYEELERKNEFLLSKYKEMQFQFKLRELDMRTQVIESISNQLISNKFESLLYEMHSSMSKQDDKTSLIVKNPFYCEPSAVKKFIGQSNRKDSVEINLENNKEKHDRERDTHESEIIPGIRKIDKLNSVLKENKDDENENAEINSVKDNLVKREEKEACENISIKEWKENNNDFHYDINERKNVLAENIPLMKEDNLVKNSLKPKTKKKMGRSEKVFNAGISQDNDKENKKSHYEKDNKSLLNEEKYEIKSKVNKIDDKNFNSDSNSYLNSVFSKKEEEPILLKNNLKKSLKQKDKEKLLKSYIEEEDEGNINSDEETRIRKSNDSSESSDKPKHKNKNKKPAKSKKTNRKVNKTNSDTESDLDYSIDSLYGKHKSFKNKKSTDYDEEIEEEKSNSYEEEKESFKEIKKKNKKTKKTKKGKKIK